MNRPEDHVEINLKDLLEDIIRALESVIADESELKEVESYLKDYDNVCGLVDIIRNLFALMVRKTIKKVNQETNNEMDSDYCKLEETIQRHEAEIRNHISLEQQMKLYTEQLQQTIEDKDRSNHKLQKELDRLQGHLRDTREQLQRLENEQIHQKSKSKYIVHTDYDLKGSTTQRKHVVALDQSPYKAISIHKNSQRTSSQHEILSQQSKLLQKTLNQPKLQTQLSKDSIKKQQRSQSQSGNNSTSQKLLTTQITTQLSTNQQSHKQTTQMRTQDIIQRLLKFK